jgi:hypothetical protein
VPRWSNNQRLLEAAAKLAGQMKGGRSPRPTALEELRQALEDVLESRRCGLPSEYSRSCRRVKGHPGDCG